MPSCTASPVSGNQISRSRSSRATARLRNIGRTLMEAKLDMVLEQVGRDKNIDKSVLISALEQAILTAAKRTFGMNREMEAKFNPETGSVDLFLIVYVVEDVAIEGREITVADAHKAGLEAELGDELLFQIFYRAEDDDRAKEQDEKFGVMID